MSEKNSKSTNTLGPAPSTQQREQIIDYREVGASGLKRFSGFIYEEFLPILTGWKGVAVYKEMSSNDPTVGAILFSIQMLCRRVPWRVKPASDDQRDKEAALFIEQCMNDMSNTWVDTIIEILSMLTYGYSVHEIVYKRRCGASIDPSMRSKYNDGRIGWRKFPIRSQDSIYRWQFDDHGGIQGVEQLAPPHYYHVVIPIEKMLLFRTTIEKNNPEGRSMLRNAYRPWYMKKNIEQIEGIGIERDLAGLPTAIVPPEMLSANASPGEKALLASIKNIITNIRRDEQEGVVFPGKYDANGKPMFELKLLSTGGSRQFDTDKIINRYDQRIAMTVLADFLLLGHNAVGSFALASSKTKLFSTAIGAFLDMISSTFNRYAIPRLFDLNDFKISAYPEISHGDIEDTDLKDLGDYIQKLSQSGMPLFPNDELEKHLLTAAKLPVPKNEEDSSLHHEPIARPKFSNTLVIPADPLQEPNDLNHAPDMTPAYPQGQLQEVITTNGSGNTETLTNRPNPQAPNQNPKKRF